MVFASGNMSKPEDFLPYELGYLTPEMEQIAEKELGETEEKRQRCKEELRALLKNEKNLYVRMDDNWMHIFLRGRKFNVHQAFKSIQNSYRLKNEFAHIYDSLSNEPVHNVFRKNLAGFLPYRDKDGRVILVVKLGQWDPEEIPRDLMIWTGTHCTMHSIEDPATQVLGYTIIFDVRGCGNRHLKLCTLQNIKLMLFGALDSFPGRYKAIHVVGVSHVFALGYALFYPLIPHKLRKRIFIHGNDLQLLHKIIPPCILPSEYGGELGPFNNKAWHDLILSRNEWCLEQRLYGYK